MTFLSIASQQWNVGNKVFFIIEIFFKIQIICLLFLQKTMDLQFGIVLTSECEILKFNPVQSSYASDFGLAFYVCYGIYSTSHEMILRKN